MAKETPLRKQLVEKQSDCYFFIVKQVKNKERSQDLLQEVSYKVIRKEDSYKEENKFWPYMQQIMNRTILNDYRSIVRRQTIIAPNEEFYELYSFRLTTENDVIPDITAHEIMEMIRLHGEEVYAIFCMIIEGYSRKEIAEKLEKSEDEIDAIIARKRKVFKQWYKENYL